jgi:hypothetical protein
LLASYQSDRTRGVGLLYKPIATATTVVVFLKLDELQFAKRLENILEILFGDTEVNIAYIEAVEGNGTSLCAGAVGGANLAVLLSLGELYDNRDT